MSTGELNAGGNPVMNYRIPSKEGVKAFSIASCLRNGDKHRSAGPLDSYTDFAFLPISH